FKDQPDATEKEKVSKLVAELRELAVKGQAADASIDAETIRDSRSMIIDTQQVPFGRLRSPIASSRKCQPSAS
ncbi:hypothetical protein PLICRDRAFT_180326, partial [Plicaturopsis crispa FD-325 SS-3]